MGSPWKTTVLKRRSQAERPRREMCNGLRVVVESIDGKNIALDLSATANHENLPTGVEPASFLAAEIKGRALGVNRQECAVPVQVQKNTWEILSTTYSLAVTVTDDWFNLDCNVAQKTSKGRWKELIPPKKRKS